MENEFQAQFENINGQFQQVHDQLEKIQNRQLNKESLHTGNSYANYRMNSLPLPRYIQPALPKKRMPAELDAGYEVPEDLGQLSPGDVAVNGAFRDQPPTQPQKSLFLTFEKGNNYYHDCHMPIKINIPGGDNGLYKLTVNEVLFRNDAPIFVGRDEWFTLTIQPSFRLQIFNDAQQVYVNDNYSPATLKKTFRYNLNADLANASFTSLSTNQLIQLLQAMLEDNAQFIEYPFGNAEHEIQIPAVDLPKITINNHEYTAQQSMRFNGYNLTQQLNINTNLIEGTGVYFYLNLFEDEAQISLNNPIFRSPGVADLALVGRLILNEPTFTFSCSPRLRNIFPSMITLQEKPSKSIPIIIDNMLNYDTRQGIFFLYCNFAGPLLFLLNTNIQTTCPIANETAAQFNTAALSYNTDMQALGLVQMNSNIPLILKEGMDFRAWLSDIQGNPVTIQSPMYLQVTIEPFSNAQYQQQQM